MSKIRVSYGNPSEKLDELSRSYKEARMALEVGRIFYAEQAIIPYGRLGIGRLIYQLPIPLCKMYLKEVFGDKLPDTFDVFYSVSWTSYNAGRLEKSEADFVVVNPAFAILSGSLFPETIPT